MSMVRGHRGKGLHLAKIVLLFLLALLFLLPFYVIFRNAFTSEEGFVSAQWTWIPDNLHISVLTELFDDPDLDFASAMVHSAVQSVGQTVLTILVSFMAGYALARFDNKVTDVVAKLTVLTLMVPTAVTFVPSFIMTSQLGWIDSYRGLIIPMSFSAFATYLFRASLMEFPQELEEAVLADDYFIERRLYPNVDFYSGIVLRALGIPLNMFTVMFAIGRVPGWIAHWLEQFNDPSIRICRPRQVYDGPASMTWVPREERS